MIFRILYVALILCLVGIITFSKGYLRGHEEGYSDAMANIILGLDSPDYYFMRKLEAMRKGR
jgi:hypothetical protein